MLFSLLAPRTWPAEKILRCLGAHKDQGWLASSAIEGPPKEGEESSAYLACSNVSFHVPAGWFFVMQFGFHWPKNNAFPRVWMLGLGILTPRHVKLWTCGRLLDHGRVLYLIRPTNCEDTSLLRRRRVGLLEREPENHHRRCDRHSGSDPSTDRWKSRATADAERCRRVVARTKPPSESARMSRLFLPTNSASALLPATKARNGHHDPICYVIIRPLRAFPSATQSVADPSLPPSACGALRR